MSAEFLTKSTTNGHTSCIKDRALTLNYYQSFHFALGYATTRDHALPYSIDNGEINIRLICSVHINSKRCTGADVLYTNVRSRTAMTSLYTETPGPVSVTEENRLASSYSGTEDRGIHVQGVMSRERMQQYRNETDEDRCMCRT